MHSVALNCVLTFSHLVFSYIGMLRHHFETGYTDSNGNTVSGLAPWIYDELKSIAALSYQFEDEGDVTDIVEDIAGECVLSLPFFE